MIHLICKSCGAFFVRYPCPSCGETREETPPSEEFLRKPSDIRRESFDKPEVKQETKNHIILPEKPSKDNKKEERSEDESLVKPSLLKGRSSVNPNFDPEKPSVSSSIQAKQQLLLQKKPKTRKKEETVKKSDLRPIQQQVLKLRNSVEMREINPNLKSKGETDEAYRRRVRETLQEVMSLLEKLIFLVYGFASYI